MHQESSQTFFPESQKQKHIPEKNIFNIFLYIQWRPTLSNQWMKTFSKLFTHLWKGGNARKCIHFEKKWGDVGCVCVCVGGGRGLAFIEGRGIHSGVLVFFLSASHSQTEWSPTDVMAEPAHARARAGSPCLPWVSVHLKGLNINGINAVSLPSAIIKHSV